MFSLEEDGKYFTLGRQKRSDQVSKTILSFVDIVYKLKTADEFRAEKRKPAGAYKPNMVAMAGEDVQYVSKLIVNWD